MSDQTTFLKAIREHLDDEVVKGVFADWLEEHPSEGEKRCWHCFGSGKSFKTGVPFCENCGGVGTVPNTENQDRATYLRRSPDERKRNNFKPDRGAKWRCPSCGCADKHEVRNHSAMWGDGDVYCQECGAYVRMYDSG